MQEVGVRELKNRASRLIEEVEAGEPVVVTRRGHPAAVIVPVEEAESLLLSRAEEFVRMRLASDAGETARGATGLRRLVERKRGEIEALAARRGAHNVRLFGSVARGDAGPESDIDLLVDLEQGRSVLDLGGLVEDLRSLLGRRVDVVPAGDLRPGLRDRVLSEAVPL